MLYSYFFLGYRSWGTLSVNWRSWQEAVVILYSRDYYSPGLARLVFHVMHEVIP